jgi:3-isopropylmalate/(R)-2-methylmalate dehydratase small subunit
MADMEAFKRLEAVAMPLDLPNIDTDQIIPARFLWRPRASGYGGLLFNDLRFEPDGGAVPDFVLNQPRYAGSKILIADRNFGCGSSREQAVWALYDYGFRVVIAPSFGDIFYNNCCKQGVLPVVLPEAEVTALRAALAESNEGTVSVDLERQCVEGPGGFKADFEIAAFRRRQLLDGLDDVALTMALIEAITAFEAEYDRDLPWLSAGARAVH